MGVGCRRPEPQDRKPLLRQEEKWDRPSGIDVIIGVGSHHPSLAVRAIPSSPIYAAFSGLRAPY